jgi:outer membrane protein TolC
MGNSKRRTVLSVLTFLAVLVPLSGYPADQATVTAAPETITLTQFVDQALAAGPDITLANAALGIAQAAYISSVAPNALGLKGTLSANQQSPLLYTFPNSAASPAPTGNATANAGLTVSGPFGLSVDLSATQSIPEDPNVAPTSQFGVNASLFPWDGYPGGSSLANTRQAALTFQGAQLTQDSKKKSTVYSVKQSYYTLLAQQRQLRILQSTLAQRQEEMKKTQALFDAQSANQIDLKQAQVNQRQAELDLLKAQDDLGVTREKLSALVGWPVDKEYVVAEVQDLPVPDLQLADAVKTALAQRADMKQLQLDAAAAQIALELKRGQTTPTLKVTGGVSWTRDWGRPSDSVSASAGVTVSAPVIDGGAGAAAVRQAELNAQSNSVSQAQLAASIATEIKNDLSSLRDLVARVELAQENLDLAQAQYDLTKVQFDSGVKANLDVLTASVALTTAQVSLAKARADAQLGVLALQDALGN